MTVRLRPHHVLCSIGFEGRGYSSPFIANMSQVIDGQLRAPGGEAITIAFTAQADSICAPCPNRVGMGCAKGEVIEGLDGRHAAALGIAAGDRLSWGACLDRVVETVRPDDLDHLCAGCGWLAEGMCKSALARLLQRRTGRPQAARP